MLVILVIYCLLFSIKWCGMSTTQTLIIHSLKASLTFICLVSLGSYNFMSVILPFFIPQIRSIGLTRLRPPMYIHVCEKYPNSNTCTLNMLHKKINIYRRQKTIIFYKWVLAPDDHLLANRLNGQQTRYFSLYTNNGRHHSNIWLSWLDNSS